MEKVYSVDEIRNIIKKHKSFLEEKFYVKNFLLFGSYAKNEQTAKSDIDLLVNFLLFSIEKKLVLSKKYKK